MIIIYGHRTYGAVDEQGGQHAVTRFAHVYYMPLFPTSSMWMTGPERGIPIKMSGKSVLAAYARTWGTVGAIGFAFSALGGGGLFTGLAAVALGTAAFSSWSWRKRRTEQDVLRGNLNALAFGTYCDPHLLEKDVALAMRERLEARRLAAGMTRPPEDVARFGSRNIDELACAYGLLCLHGSSTSADIAALLELKAPTTDGREGIYRDGHEGSVALDIPMVVAIEQAAQARMAD